MIPMKNPDGSYNVDWFDEPYTIERENVVDPIAGLDPVSGWRKISEIPPKHISLLVALNIGPSPIFDVACYLGKMDDGTHRWIMSDISLDHALIANWSHIIAPLSKNKR